MEITCKNCGSNRVLERKKGVYQCRQCWNIWSESQLVLTISPDQIKDDISSDDIKDYLKGKGFVISKHRTWEKGDIEIHINHRTVTCWRSEGLYFALPIQWSVIQIMNLLLD